MKVGENMFAFLFNDMPIIRYKEWAHGLKYDIELHKYYIDGYCFNNKYGIIHTVFQLDSDSIVFLCKLLARFRSLRYQ